MERIRRRRVLRFDSTLKHALCSRCGIMLVPGATCSVQVSSKPEKAYVITCSRCSERKSFSLRKPARLPRLFWSEEADAPASLTQNEVVATCTAVTEGREASRRLQAKRNASGKGADSRPSTSSNSIPHGDESLQTRDGSRGHPSVGGRGSGARHAALASGRGRGAPGRGAHGRAGTTNAHANATHAQFRGVRASSAGGYDRGSNPPVSHGGSRGGRGASWSRAGGRGRGAHGPPAPGSGFDRNAHPYHVPPAHHGAQNTFHGQSQERVSANAYQNHVPRIMNQGTVGAPAVVRGHAGRNLPGRPGQPAAFHRAHHGPGGWTAPERAVPPIQQITIPHGVLRGPFAARGGGVAPRQGAGPAGIPSQPIHGAATAPGHSTGQQWPPGGVPQQTLRHVPANGQFPLVPGAAFDTPAALRPSMPTGQAFVSPHVPHSSRAPPPVPSSLHPPVPGEYSYGVDVPFRGSSTGSYYAHPNAAPRGVARHGGRSWPLPHGDARDPRGNPTQRPPASFHSDSRYPKG